jgi:hypothetical protein
MKLWKMKKSDFDHEKMNLVEKNVGTPAILGRTPMRLFHTISSIPPTLDRNQFVESRRACIIQKSQPVGIWNPGVSTHSMHARR